VAAPAHAPVERGAASVLGLSPRGRRLLALGAGALLPLAFAPFGIYPLAPTCLAVLFLLWEGETPRAAAGHAFAFGFGAYLIGLHWLYISLHTFGKAPLFVSLPLMLGLVAVLSGYLAALAYGVTRYGAARGLARWLLLLPAAWTIVEWLRGWVLGGFPWLAIGYSQIDAPLAGLAPLAGVFAVSFAAALTAGALLALVRGTPVQRLVAVAVAASVWLAAGALRGVTWTQPSGEPITVALVQGGITQDRKWVPEELEPTKALYEMYTDEHLDADLIVWPEAAIPALLDELTEYLSPIFERVHAHGKALLFGVVEYDADTERYYNSVLGYDGNFALYRKRHLVPFGEFFPVPQFVRRWLRLMSLPYTDFARGDPDQPPLAIGGQHIGVSICYEDVFGEELIGVLDRATLLANVSNDAWFGGSVAPQQHLQIARMRALEGGRDLMRTTNTGITAIIDASGRVLKTIPQFDPAVLSGSVQPRSGLTPYARCGNWAIVSCAFLALVTAALAARRRGR
jgi:apolipoprotein N-acyltransferase